MVKESTGDANGVNETVIEETTPKKSKEESGQVKRKGILVKNGSLPRKPAKPP